MTQNPEQADRGKALRAENERQVESVLRLVGLGIRSRGVVVGAERVRESARSGKLRLGIVARDASANTLDKIVPLLAARGINFIEVPSGAQLGAAAGRDHIAAAGVIDAQLAKGIRKLFDR